MGARPFEGFRSYRQAWNDAYHSDSAVPLNIDIELASLCNLACPFCFYGEADWNQSMLKAAADGKPKKRFMPTHLARRIIYEAAELGVPALKFNWRGESTLHPEYSAILKFARAIMVLPAKTSPAAPAFHELLVNTNANFRDHALDGLMAATKVMVSLDSCEPATYKKMRVNGSLELALRNIGQLVQSGHPNLWVRRVITKENQNEPFAAQVHQLFGNAVKVSEHACFDRNADEHHQTTDPLRFERTYCGYPSQRMMIASDGTVYPCCVDYDGLMPMGFFPDQSITQIWNGEPFKKLRAELRAGTFTSKACANCTSWMAYKSKNRELVQDIEVKP